MYDSELIFALRQLKVNTKSLACLGCRYGHDCGIHGCYLIGCAADRTAAFDARYGQPPKILRKVPTPVFPHDFKLCADTTELMQTLKFISDHGYTMVAATHYASVAYTVFFRRPASE